MLRPGLHRCSFFVVHEHWRLHMLIDAKDEYLTPALVAARFKVSIPTVYRWMSPEAAQVVKSAALLKSSTNL
jgi:hypothetical protein